MNSAFRILYAEDNDLDADLTRAHFLEHAPDFEIEVVGTGKGCLERPGIKVVYMSGYTDDAIVHHGTLDPGTNFIAKPFSAADLTRKVLEVLDSHPANPADGHAQAQKADAETRKQPFDGSVLRALPQEVVSKLRQAVIAARSDEIVEIIETIRVADPNTATELRRMADVFDYDGMRNLLR